MPLSPEQLKALLDRRQWDGQPTSDEEVQGAASAPAATSSMDPLIQQYLLRKQTESKAADSAGAEDQRLKQIAALTNLGESLGSAISQRETTGAAGKAIEGLAGNTAQLQAQLKTKESGSDLRTKELTEGQKVNTTDPTSAENRAFRALVAKRFPDVAQIPDFEKLTLESPVLAKLLSPNEFLQGQRVEATRERTKVMEGLGNKRVEQGQKRLEMQQGRYEAPEEQSMASQAGKTKVLASSINQLAEKYADNYDAMPNAQVSELALGVARMLGGGVAAQHTLDLLLPKSFQGDLNKYLSRLANEPRGAGQGAFVKNLVDLVHRESDNADSIIGKIKERRTGKPAGGTMVPSSDAIEQELARRGLK